MVDGVADAAFECAHRFFADFAFGLFAEVLADGRRCVLRITLPLGCGQTACSWDGSVAAAEVIADGVADQSAEDVIWDQENVGPTGWEPEFDKP